MVDFTIESMNQAFEIDMKSIFVIDIFPGKPYIFHVDAYTYMNGIYVINIFDVHIDLHNYRTILCRIFPAIAFN